MGSDPVMPKKKNTRKISSSKKSTHELAKDQIDVFFFFEFIRYLYHLIKWQTKKYTEEFGRIRDMLELCKNLIWMLHIKNLPLHFLSTAF